MGVSWSLTSMTRRALGLVELALANRLLSEDIFAVSEDFFTVWRSVLYWGNGSSAARSAVALFVFILSLAEVSVSLQRNLSISL